jgi:hypothetical protein
MFLHDHVRTVIDSQHDREYDTPVRVYSHMDIWNTECFYLDRP